ncbi:MAG TPA: PAS domain S-box protein, partial [Anaerolineales bacterium]|nr:PAS domain S-box protein [Anaerolineales bacterium]
MNELHSLLKRQLRRYNSEAGPTSDGESDFLQAINDAYWQFDADRRMLEHSLDLTSRELLERNADLSRINTELEQRVEERTASLRSTLNFMYSLFQVTQSVIAFEDLQDVLKSIVTSATDTLSADRSVVITFDHEEKRVVHLVGAGEGVDNIIASVTYHELMEGLSGWVVREGRPALSPKGELDPRESAAAQKRRQETNCGCIAVLPLSYMGEILGIMTVINRPEQPDFTPQEVAWMEAIAIQTSTAIGRAQTYDQLKKANAFMEKQSERLQQELTDRELAESALAVERDLLQALMDNIPDTIYSKDAASRFTRINPAQAKVLGVASPEEAIGKSDFDFQPTELSRGFYEEEQRIIETGMPLINRIEFNPTMDGRPRWFSATKVPVRNSDGNVTGIVGVSRDITLVRQAEDALREAETKYRTLVENMPAIVYIDLADEPHNTIYINPQVQDMLGYSSEDWIAKPDLCNDIVHPEDSEHMWKEAKESQTRGRYAGDYRYIAKDGRVVWVHDE